MNPQIQAADKPLLGDPAPAPLRPESELRAALDQRLADRSAPLPDLRGQRLIGFELEGIDLSGVDLSGADLSGSNLSGARLMGAKLRATVLFEANLNGAEMAGADLHGANLADAQLESAGFGQANLQGADLTRANLHHACLVEANLSEASLAMADLHAARLNEACLRNADLRRANLEHAELDGADVGNACFDDAKAREASLRLLHNYTSGSWINIDLRDVDFSGAYLLRRHILDENYLHEFRSSSRKHALIYKIWSWTCDCGRSGLRWGLFNAALVALFAVAYTQVQVDYGDHETWLSPVYFSVVTMTTLGYGDVLPMTPMAQFVTILQVISGYVMLGGLLGIVTKKLASRAE